jgi:glutathione peroxidase
MLASQSMLRAADSASSSLYDIDATSAGGEVMRMDRFRGQVLLVVNVASRCGFTPQYAALEALYRKYKDRGFVVLGFPCNQFGAQEPGSEADILGFCTSTYGVTFPLFAKVDVNGKAAHPLFVLLKSQQSGLLGASVIKWNFTKFLVDRNGRVTARFSPATKPAAIEPHIVRLLG